MSRRARHRRRTPRLRVALACAAAGLVCVPIGAAGIGWRVVEVTSDSMAPTLRTGDRVLAAPSASDPEVGDIVVFRPPPSWREAFPRWSDGASVPDRMVKRVVAVGGDLVVCCAADGALTVNGRRLDEPYLAVAPGHSNNPTYRVVVPEDELWLLGDNREGSFDSALVRAMTGDGAVPASALTGRVVGHR